MAEFERVLNKMNAYFEELFFICRKMHLWSLSNTAGGSEPNDPRLLIEGNKMADTSEGVDKKQQRRSQTAQSLNDNEQQMEFYRHGSRKPVLILEQKGQMNNEVLNMKMKMWIVVDNAERFVEVLQLQDRIGISKKREEARLFSPTNKKRPRDDG